MNIKTLFLCVIAWITMNSCGVSSKIKNYYIYSDWQLKSKNENDVLEDKDKIKKLSIYNYTYDTFPTSILSKLSKVKEITLSSEYFDDEEKYRELKIDRERLTKLATLKRLHIGAMGGFSIEKFPIELNVLKKLEEMSLYVTKYKSIEGDLSHLENLKVLNIGNDDLLKISETCKFPKSLIKLTISSSKLESFSKKSIIDTKNLELEIINIGANINHKINMINELLEADSLKKLKLYVETCEEKNFILSKIDSKKAKHKLKIKHSEECKEGLFN